MHANHRPPRRAHPAAAIAAELGFAVLSDDVPRVVSAINGAYSAGLRDAALEAERAARIAAQTEAVELKERLARSGVEERRAVAAEREACAGLMASLRAKSCNHLFRSALAIAEGEIRARGAA